MRILLCTSMFIGAFLLPICGVDSASADGDNTVATSFTLDLMSQQAPFPLIYIKGEMAGLAPGSVEIPLESEGVVVEIGFPQLGRLPLYSFVLGPTEFERLSVDLIVTSFEFGEPRGDDVWGGVYVQPNKKQTIKIVKEEENSYQLALPATPYLGLMKFWQRSEIQPYGSGWFASLKSENDKSAAGGVDHVVFNSITKTTDFLSNMQDKSWSGGYELAAWELPAREEHWTIKSEPPEAEVFTDLRLEGRTVVEIDVKITSGFFVVLKKDEFYDCPHQKCTKTRTARGVELFCQLRKKR